MDVGLKQGQSKAPPAAMPSGWRWALGIGLGSLFAGALYLISVRGEALLLDLSALSQRVFCF